MIRSFDDRETELIWNGEFSRRLPREIQAAAQRKLRLLDAAKELDNLRFPRGNQFEALKKDRIGQHSIRINRQWRICFVWKEGNAYEVEIVDYH